MKENKETNEVSDAISRAQEELDESSRDASIIRKVRSYPDAEVKVSHHIAYPFPDSLDGDVYASNRHYIDKVIAEHGAVAMLGPIEADLSIYDQMIFRQHATVFTAESTDEQKINELMERRKNLQNAKEVKRLREQLATMKMNQRAAAFLLGVIDSDDSIDWDIVTEGIDWFDNEDDDCYCCDCCGCDC